MPKYVFSAEFECIEDHSFLIKGMFVNTLQSLLATNGIKAIGPVELCRASDNSEEKQNDQPTGNNTSAEEPPSPQGEITPYWVCEDCHTVNSLDRNKCCGCHKYKPA